MINEKLNKDILDLITQNTNNINRLKAKLLWTNQNPTNTMADGTNINLSSDDYDLLIWIYCYSNAVANITINSASACLKGSACLMTLIGYSTGALVRRRLDYVNDKKYTASAGVTSGGGDGSGYCIPLYCIGVKYQF